MEEIKSSTVLSLEHCAAYIIMPWDMGMLLYSFCACTSTTTFSFAYIVVMTYVLPKLMLLQELYALQILVEEPRFISESR